MGVNIGWIFGSVAAFSVVWGAIFFPELKVCFSEFIYAKTSSAISTNYANQGRSLEEVDELFAANLKAWQFKKYETHGTGRLLTALEGETEPAAEILKGFQQSHVENVPSTNNEKV